MKGSWSAGEDERLRDLAQSGLSFEEIALRMNRSRSAVRDHAEKLKITVASGRMGLRTSRRLVELGLKAKK